MLAETGTERDAFLALVYADADWLRAEFDAIVDASWDEPPAGPERPGRPDAAPAPAAGTRRRDQALPPWRPVAACPARQRSPPNSAVAPWSSGVVVAVRRERGRSSSRGGLGRDPRDWYANGTAG